MAQIRTKVGEPYSEVVVEEDIKNLYKSGAILNVRFFAQPEGNGLHGAQSSSWLSKWRAANHRALFS